MGQAYFYNLTEFSTQLTLNDFVPGETIAKVPSTAPYTPNASATTYSRTGGVAKATMDLKLPSPRQYRRSSLR